MYLGQCIVCSEEEAGLDDLKIIPPWIVLWCRDAMRCTRMS